MAPKKASGTDKEAMMLAKFNELDKDGNGSLDFDELEGLLKKGNPTFTTAEVKQLYDACDTNHDGKIEFREFLAYINKADHKADRTGGRHARMAAASGPQDDGTEKDWGPVSDVFANFAGSDMDGREFAKFCKDSGLIGHGFTKADVDMTFAKVVPKGKRRMDFVMFQDALRLMAGKRGQTNGEVQDLVSASKGPVITATATDAVRFYDDKSTFTGAHAHNEKFDGVNSSAALGRHERQVAAEHDKTHGGAEGGWGECQRVYEAFSENNKFEGKHFLKMCLEVNGLLAHGFAKRDVDLIFAAAAKKDKHLSFEQFKECVRKVAAKRGQSPQEVQAIIARSDGPILHATQTEAVRFHDDKSTYTGAHASVHGRDGHDDGRHEKLAMEAAKLRQGDEGEHDWAGCDSVYDMFLEDGKLKSRDFMKMMIDVNMFDKNFTKNDVDTTFVHAAGRGVKDLSVETFHVAIREIAQKKKVPIYKVQQAIESCEGPHLAATKADAVRFHDDKDTYTGMHVGK